MPYYQERFGTSTDTIGDLNNDGFTDLIVGATIDDDGGNKSGAVNYSNYIWNFGDARRAAAKSAYFIRLQGDDFVRMVKVIVE
jgi:hypothetical protein